MEQLISFEFNKIVMPRLDCTFLAIPTKQDFEQAVRVEVLVVDDYNIRILLGVKLSSVEKISEHSKVDIIVEMIGDFKLNTKIPVCEKLSDVPVLANMTAVIYPFVREKMYYCLTNNNYSLLLGSINVYEFIQQGEGKHGFKLTDSRKNRQIELENAK